MVRVVAKGTWLYDHTVPTEVRIVETDYDVWFEIEKADGDLTHDETPRLNEWERAYYLHWRPGADVGQPFWPDSEAFMSIGEAKEAAAERLPSRVTWQ